MFGQDAANAGEPSPGTTWTRPRAWVNDESIPVQKWNSPEGGHWQVHYADAAAGASGGLL